MSDPASQRPDPPSADLPPIERLVRIMAILRSPQGCPWDREQNLTKLKDHLVEESYEVLDAIDSGDRAKLREELGDLLLQVVFQSQLCREEGAFTFDDVATTIVEKLIRRHPHVFGDVQADNPDQVLRNWEQIKRAEKEGKPRSTVEGLPKHLPALHKAHLLQKKVARVGFDWKDSDGPLDKLDEEIREVREAVASGDQTRVREEVGDLLFSVVNVSRFLGHNPEDLLHANIGKFMRRFQALEDAVHAQGRKLENLSLAEMDAIWNQIKAAE